MGLGGISLTQLIVILAIVIVVFGTKRVKSLGGDLGAAIKGFRSAVNADGDTCEDYVNDADQQQRIERSNDSDPDAVFADRKDNARHG